MKNEKTNKFGRRILSIVLTAALVVGLMPGNMLKVSVEQADALAEENTGNMKTIAGLGTSVIADPTAPASSSDAWNGSYVYYGNYNSSPVKCRVLDASTTDYSADGTTQTMFLDCDSILYYQKFDSDGTANEDGKKANDWSISDVKSSLNGDGFLNKEGVFTTAEKNAIAKSNVASHALTTNSATGVNVASWTQKNLVNYVALTGEQIFLLDAEDVSNGAYGYSMTDSGCENHKKTGSSGAYWWLRSAGSGDRSAGCVISGGDISQYIVGYDRPGVSPALNLNLSSVLFSSVISGTAGETGAEYKLTLLDRDMTIAASGDVTRNGKVVIVPYSISGTNSANATQVSVLILDKEYTAGNTNGATVLDYQKLNVDSFSASGTGTFTLPSGLTGTLGTDYHIYLLAEQVNADNSTDYASEPVKVEKITCTDADNNGICDHCDSYVEPKQEDEYYQIANAGNLMWFAQQVNEGQTTINAKLTADIAMNGIDWTMMSSFAGTFDGNGYTISGLNGHKAYIANTHGFIRTLADGGVVKNLTFTEADIWNHEGSGAISAVIVYTNYGTVENCVVKSSLIQLGNYDALGVVVGVNGGTIRNCASISNTVKRRYEGVKNKAASVFVWSNGSDATIENCMVYDCTYTDASANYAFTGINNGTITNCYYYESSETISDTVATAKTADQFASGEVTYLLNGEKTDGTQSWYQTLKTDTYPVPDNTHGTVYSIFACNGTTPAGYSNENKNEPHIDANGDEYCDNCLAIYNGIGAHLAGYSVSLNGSIGVNFHMDLTQDVLDDNEAYMLFTLPNGTTQKVMVSDAKESAVIEGKTYYIFTCNVAAKEMTDTIQAQLITSDGSKTQVYEYSVRKYANRILSGSYDDETIELVKAMLHYGAYSQEWFNYNTTNLANEGLDILDLSDADDWDLFKPSISNNEKVGSFTSAYLTLESDTAINLKFKLADGVSFEDLRVEVHDSHGNVVPVTTDTTGNVCLITLTGIKASDLDTMYEFRVTDKEGNESAILYSAMSYARTVAKSEMDQKLKNVTAALRIFNLRADAKFEY